MPSKKETAARATEIFEHCSYPNGLNANTAWLGIYQALLWYESTGGTELLPHIIDADKLRQPTYKGDKAKGGSRPWIERARRVHLYLCEKLGCSSSKVIQHFDLLMRSTGYEGLQRQNPLGIAFAELVAHVLRRFGSPQIANKTEVPAHEVFPGVSLQSRSANPKIDLVAFKAGKPVGIVTTKWSIRHDRLTDVIDEAITYKSAAMRTGLKLPCCFVTNEFDPARLDKLLKAKVVDAVVHVNPELVTQVCRLNERLRELRDIPYLISASTKW